MDGIGKGIGEAIAFLFWAAIICGGILLVLGGYQIIDWLWLDEVYRVSEPIQPEIEYKIINGTEIDTTYVYRFK